MNQRSSSDHDSTPPPRAKLPTWAWVVIIVGGVLLALRIFSALAIQGTRGYLMKAKTSEGTATVGAIARGMVACMDGGGPAVLLEEPGARAGSAQELPPSAPAVPALVPRGAKYMSGPSDWTSPAFTCARFKLSVPQYFQYEWERVSPLVGVVHARADLDGDGRVDVEISQEIRCPATGLCTPGPLVTK